MTDLLPSVMIRSLRAIGRNFASRSGWIWTYHSVRVEFESYGQLRYRLVGCAEEAPPIACVSARPYLLAPMALTLRGASAVIALCSYSLVSRADACCGARGPASAQLIVGLITDAQDARVDTTSTTVTPHSKMIALAPRSMATVNPHAVATTPRRDAPVPIARYATR